MLLNEVFDQRSIVLNLEGKSKEAAFSELVEAIAAIHPELDHSTMLEAVHDREKKMNTSIASGVAVPHGYYPGMNDIAGAIGISSGGIDYDALDNKPVHFLFLIVMGEACREKHLRVLNRVVSLVNSGAISNIQAAQNPQEVSQILSRFT